MCDRHIIDTVKNKMLSRRDLFKASAGGGALAAVGGMVSATSALAAGHSRVEDMTHELHENFPTYFGKSQFKKTQTFNWEEHKFNLFELSLSEHVGTHIDAPLHFSEDGRSVAEIPVSQLFAPLCVIDIRSKAAENSDVQLTPNDVKAWISTNGDIPDNACVAMNSGWAAKIHSDGFRNADDEGKQHYPGFHVEAAKMLMEETGAASIAVDTLSLDHGPSADFATHYAWLSSERFGIENLARLDDVPAKGATLVVGAPKIRGGTGGPARIFAMM